MKKYLQDILYAYKTWHLFNFFWIVPPERLIDVLNFFKRILFWKEKRQILKQSFYIRNQKLTFFADSKYEQRIIWFFDYLKNIWEEDEDNNNEIKILVWDYKTKFDKDFDIFLDLADETNLNKKFLNKKYIKRECLEEDMKKYNLISLPYLFSNNSNLIGKIQLKCNKEVKYYLSFWWQIKSKDNNRKQIINELKNKLWDKFYNYWLSFEKHIETLNQSKYALNIFWAWEYCHRFTEIALSDTLIVSQKYHIYIPNNYTDMVNIVFFDDIDELIIKLKYLDENPEVYDNIKHKFKKHFQKHHSHEKWCEFLLKCITK